MWPVNMISGKADEGEAKDEIWRRAKLKRYPSLTQIQALEDKFIGQRKDALDKFTREQSGNPNFDCRRMGRLMGFIRNHYISGIPITTSTAIYDEKTPYYIENLTAQVVKINETAYAQKPRLGTITGGSGVLGFTHFIFVSPQHALPRSFFAMPSFSHCTTVIDHKIIVPFAEQNRVKEMVRLVNALAIYCNHDFIDNLRFFGQIDCEEAREVEDKINSCPEMRANFENGENFALMTNQQIYDILLPSGFARNIWRAADRLEQLMHEVDEKLEWDVGDEEFGNVLDLYKVMFFHMSAYTDRDKLLPFDLEGWKERLENGVHKHNFTEMQFGTLPNGEPLMMKHGQVLNELYLLAEMLAKRKAKEYGINLFEVTESVIDR